MITAGASRVASGPLCVHAIAITPASSMELVRSSISIDCGLPPETVGSAPAIVFSGPAQRSLHVTACTLAESPSDPLHRGLRQLCCLRCRLDCYRVERTSSRAGVSPAEVQRLSRRTVSPTIRWSSCRACAFKKQSVRQRRRRKQIGPGLEGRGLGPGRFRTLSGTKRHPETWHSLASEPESVRRR